MNDIDWKAKFPKLRPLSGSPPLFTINGCGLSIHGNRDADAETKTYVTTYCLTFVFIPILPLCAYRVAPAGGGRYYFIGKEPLSKFCKAYNLLALCGILLACAISAWVSYSTSPEYRAGVQFNLAQTQLASGQIVAAARTLSAVSYTDSTYAPKAAAQFNQIVDGDFTRLSTMEVVSLLQVAANMSKDPQRITALGNRALNEANTRGAAHAADALKLLPVARTLVPKAPELPALQRELLEAAVKQNPDDVALVSELAQTFEETKDFENCRALLEPLAAKLGSADGARILGEIYARAERYEQAFPLLSPYVATRLDKFRQLEASYKRVVEQEQQAELQRLRSGVGDPAFFRNFKSRDKVGQQEMIDRHFTDFMRNNGRLKTLLAEFKKEAAIVPVVLDLGMVRLRRAQQMTGDARNAELKEAEKLFLAISDAAGGSDDFKLFYAQVSFWLGKSEQGRKLIDDLLAAHRGDAKITLPVVLKLNEVGENKYASELAEKVYNDSAAGPLEKTTAARIRANLAAERDERIQWLERCQNLPEAEAALSQEKGIAFEEQGNYAAAAVSFRKAFDFYERQVSSSGTLNNAALNALNLFSVTSDPADQQRGLKMLLQALELEPENSILMENTATALLQESQLAITSAVIDRKAIMAKDTDLHSALYDDRAGRDAVQEKFRALPSWTQCRNLIDRLILVAPKNPDGPLLLEQALLLQHDTAGIHALSGRIKTTTFDLSRQEMAVKKRSDGSDSADVLRGLQVRKTQLEKILKDARLDVKSGAALQCCLAETICHMAPHSDSAELDTAVKFAGVALAMDPSILARDTQIEALLERIAKTLALQDPEFRAMRQRMRFGLHCGCLLSWSFLQPGPFRERLLQNDDFKTLLAALKERGARIPDDRSIWEFAFFAATDPAEAQRVADSYKDPSAYREDFRFDQLLYPSPNVVMKAYLLARMDGKDAEARTLLDDAAKRGMTLPVKADAKP